MYTGSQAGKVAVALIIAAVLASLLLPVGLPSIEKEYSILLRAAPHVLMVGGGPLILGEGEKGVLLIPPAFTPYSQEEVLRIKELASSGWIIVILCGPGFERIVAEALGYTVSTRPLRQYGVQGMLVYYDDMRIRTPPLYSISTHSGNASVLASSPYSWIDYNDNGIYDPGENLGMHAVAMAVKMNGGVVVAVSAPTLHPLRDAGKGWNEMLLGLLRRYGGNSTIYVDLSKQPRPSAIMLLAAAYIMVHRYGILLLSFTYLSAATVLAGLTSKPKLKSSKTRGTWREKYSWGILPSGHVELDEKRRSRLEALWIEEV